MKTDRDQHASLRPCVPSDWPGGHPEVLLHEVAGDGQRQEGDEKDGGHVGDDAQSGQAQQGGAGEALQGGGDVLVNCVCVCGKPVEDAAERSRLKQPAGTNALNSVCDLRFHFPRIRSAS